MTVTKSMLDGLDYAREKAKKFGLSLEKTADFISEILHDSEPERSEPTVRNMARQQIADIYRRDPNADYLPEEVALRVGLKATRADVAFVRHNLWTLRLGYHTPTPNMAPAE